MWGYGFILLWKHDLCLSLKKKNIYIYIYRERERERERDFIRIIKKEVEQRVEKIEQGNHLLTLNSINLTWETT